MDVNKRNLDLVEALKKIEDIMSRTTYRNSDLAIQKVIKEALSTQPPATIVKSKSIEQFKQMVRAKEIQHLSTSDSGEISHYGTIGNPSRVMGFWWCDHGQEYLVVDHPNPISRESYEGVKIFFEELK